MDDFSKKSNVFRFKVLEAVIKGHRDLYSITGFIGSKGDPGSPLRRTRRALEWLVERNYLYYEKDLKDVLYYYETGKFGPRDYSSVVTRFVKDRLKEIEKLANELGWTEFEFKILPTTEEDYEDKGKIPLEADVVTLKNLGRILLRNYEDKNDYGSISQS